jgi:hypothetical protein
MMGGYAQYPAQPTPDPKQVGQQLMQQQMPDEEQSEGMTVDQQEGPGDTESPTSSAPPVHPANAISSGYMSQSGVPSGLLAQVGDALQRVQNGATPVDTPERMVTAPNRFQTLLQMGMSPEEAQLMMQTGGA